MKIIGLTGFARSGKSTAVEVLKQIGGEELAFAKHLKDVCSIVFNIPRDHFDDQRYKEIEFSIPVILYSSHIDYILSYFDVPKYLVPQAILTHQNVVLKSPRHVAQYIGTELLRSIDQNIHVNMAFKLNQNSKAKFLICSDVRFLNELLVVTKNGGTVFGISRKNAIPQDLENLHSSEMEIPDLISKSHEIIHNDGSIEEFKLKIKNLALSYL